MVELVFQVLTAAPQLVRPVLGEDQAVQEVLRVGWAHLAGSRVPARVPVVRRVDGQVPSGVETLRLH